jgi:aminoacrylate hydrolase
MEQDGVGREPSYDGHVLLITGLGGAGRSWGEQVQRFAASHYVILPDQRGTGLTTRAQDGYTTEQLARDMAALVDHLGLAPVHVVGASTGGAIGQHLALERPEIVRSLTMSSSFARFDPFLEREFEIRRKMAAEWDRRTLMTAYALFLLGPRFTHDHPDRVSEWIERAAGSPETPADREIGLKRIDMIAAHNTYDRLGEIRTPSLVTCGSHNFCTTLPQSQDIAARVPGAELVIFDDAGELIEFEQPEKFFQTVGGFIDRHS